MQAIQPDWWDALFIAWLCVFNPLYGALVSVPRIRAMPQPEQDRLRPRVYWNGLLTFWFFGIVSVTPWLGRDAPLSAIGISLPGPLWPAVAVVLALAGAGVMLQRRAVMRAPEGAQQVRRQLRTVEWLLPRSRREVVMWGGISLHAGICEELLYRGYLFALARSLMPDIAACIVVTALFGMAHLYQGLRGVVYTTCLGAVFLALAWFSDSLWLPMLAHALFDWHAGTLGSWAFGKADAGQQPT